MSNVYSEVVKTLMWGGPASGIRAGTRVLSLACGHVVKRLVGGNTGEEISRAKCQLCTNDLVLRESLKAAPPVVVNLPAEAPTQTALIEAIQSLQAQVAKLSMAKPQSRRWAPGARAAKMHFAKNGGTRCGRPAIPVFITDDSNKVGCQLCLSLMVDGQPVGLVK